MSKTRKKHVKTEYEKQRKNFRQDTYKHVVSFEADMSEDDKRHAFNLSDKLRILSNNLKDSLNVKIKQLKREKEYKTLIKHYGKIKESLKNTNKSETAELKEVSVKLENYIKNTI